MNSIYWKNKLLKTIDALCLASTEDNIFYDVLYCEGTLYTGEKVRVKVPFMRLNKGSIKEEILKYAKDENVYAKGLSIFEAVIINEPPDITCIHGNMQLKQVMDFVFYECNECGAKIFYDC